MESNESDEKKAHKDGEKSKKIDVDAEELNASLTHEHDSKETNDVDACSPENIIRNTDNVNEAQSEVNILPESGVQIEVGLAKDPVPDGASIEKCQTSDITVNEPVPGKCDDEPMDIDEILDSLNTDQDASPNNEEMCDPQPMENHDQALLEPDDPSKMDVKLLENIENIENVESNIVDCLSTSNVEENVYNEELSSEEMNLPSESNLNALNDVVLLEDSTFTDNVANVESKTIRDEIFDESKSVLLSTDENELQVDLDATAKELVKEIIQNDPEENDKIGQSAAVEDVNQTKMVGQSEEIEEHQAQEPDVFDLLRENEDLFGKVDENIDESQKLDETQSEDVEMQDKSNVADIEEISVSSETNTETEPQILELSLNENDGKLHEKSVCRRECLNVECEKKSDIFYEAPEFIVNYFHMNKRQKVQYACEYCYDSAIKSYEELTAALIDKQPIFLRKIKYTDLVEIIDSSDEEDDDANAKDSNNGEGCQSFDADTLALIENELEVVIKETLDKIDINQQMEWNRQILATKLDNNEKNSKSVMDEMNILQKRIDKLYTETYNFRHNFVEEVQSLDLQTLKPTQICNETYPPVGELKHPEIQFNTLYYTFRNRLISRWLPCKVINKVETDGQSEYVVKFCRERKIHDNVKTIPRKNLAYGRAPEHRLNIGTRVIALFDNSDNNSNTKNIELKSNFYPGVVAEPLSRYTNWRYLVFFDDGWVQYVQHENIRVLCEDAENVWELIEEAGAKTFIEGYLREFKKKRPIVQVERGQRIQTELGGKWYNAIVNAVDGSLVQIFFEENKRYEWIYRGSTRLFPLYRKLKHVTSVNRNEATIEYIVIDDEKEPERSIEPPVEEQPQSTPAKCGPIQRTFASQAARDTPQQKQREQKRAVAKKSTGTHPKPAVQHMNNSTIYVDEDKPKGKVVYYTAKKHIDVKKYINHECQPNCLVQVQHNLSSYSPLSKPLLSGFERQICKTRFNKKYVVYRGPCGRRIRDMYEMRMYLRLTDCKLNVDNFTFDPLIHCLAEYVIESYVLKRADLSEGVEKMPVQLVNCYDNSMPPPCTYSAKRIPTEGVNLNCDSEFLCGCDCEDDCIDKTKCACWQLTLQGAKYGNPDLPIEEVGYEYKRLNDPVPSGIYECNSSCKCNSNCLNRVVQHPLNLKLQVFKTVNRGWGLRCLNDVPKGSFICCYAGNLLTETAANEAGGDLGDEYFAELDYIEVVENMKEGYEPDVVNDDIESSETDDDFDVEMESIRTRNDDSDDEFVARSYTASEDSESRRYRTRNSVDRRKKETAPPIVQSKQVEKRRERNSSSDEEADEIRQVKNFMASNTMPLNDDPDDDKNKSGIRKFFGENEAVYIMDAKKAGNIGRYFNHSCGPNLFVQNVFVDTHDLRFPWVAFFASTHIRAGTELTWNYNYEVGSVPGKVLICQCGDEKCRGRIL